MAYPPLPYSQNYNATCRLIKIVTHIRIESETCGGSLLLIDAGLRAGWIFLELVKRVDQTQSEQPHWIAPVVTIMRKAYLFIAAVGFLLSSTLTFAQDGFFCRLVQHGLRNASRTAPHGGLTIAASPH
jgi:hypothetical protein